MKNKQKSPPISTESKSKLLSKGNGITTIFERVFNRAHEDSDPGSSELGNGTDYKSEIEISVHAQDHQSSAGKVNVLGQVNSYGPEVEVRDPALDVPGPELEVQDQEGGNGNDHRYEEEYNGYVVVEDEPADVNEEVPLPAADVAFEGEPAEMDEDVPQPAMDAYPFQADPGVEGPPYTYLPNTEDMESQEPKQESEYKNGDQFEHDVEQLHNDAEDQTDSHESEVHSVEISSEDLDKIESPLEFINELRNKKPTPERFLKRLEHEREIKNLQAELVKLQRSVIKNGDRVIVIFEGVDLTGKFDTIRKFTKYLDPRSARIVSLRERTEDEKDQWYFQRYTNQLPGKGEIVFFNRSWYERGLTEPIQGLCTDHEYGQFLSQTPDFEYMLCEHGVKIVKIWLAISPDELEKRHKQLQEDPLLKWSEGPFDEEYLEKWSEAAKYRNIMFSWTDKSFAPWTIISADKQYRMQIQAMKHVLSALDYEGKKDAGVELTPDATLVRRFHRSMIKEMG